MSVLQETTEKILDSLCDHVLFDAQPWAGKQMPSAVPESRWNGLLSMLEGDHNANAHGRHGRTALHYAMAEGNKAVVDKLLAMGADLQAKDNEGKTPLFYAVSLGRVEVLKGLIQRGALFDGDPGQQGTLLAWAANGGHAELIECLLDAGVDANAQDAEGDTALHVAAEMGLGDVVALMLEKDVSINGKNRRGDTPLTVAARNAHWGIVIDLAEKGAGVNEKDSLGVTPLHWASIDELVAHKYTTHLLQRGADPNAKVNGETPADWARRQGRRDRDGVVGILTEYARQPGSGRTEQTGNAVCP